MPEYKELTVKLEVIKERIADMEKEFEILNTEIDRDMGNVVDAMKIVEDAGGKL